MPCFAPNSSADLEYQDVWWWWSCNFDPDNILQDNVLLVDNFVDNHMDNLDLHTEGVDYRTDTLKRDVPHFETDSYRDMTDFFPKVLASVDSLDSQHLQY